MTRMSKKAREHARLAEEFSRLAFEANEIRFDGPAFCTEATLDGYSASTLVDAFAVSHYYDDMTSGPPVDSAAISAMSVLASRMIDETPLQFPEEFEMYEVDGDTMHALFESVGDVQSGEDGLSITYVDPPGQVLSCAQALNCLLDGEDWNETLCSLWLPVKANDPRTRLTLASFLWQWIQRECPNSPLTLEEIRENAFSKCPKEFKAKLEVTGLPTAALEPGFWRGYRTPEAFRLVLNEPGAKEFLDEIGLTVFQENLGRIVFPSDLHQTMHACRHRLLTDHQRYGLRPVPRGSARAKPSVVQILQNRFGKIYGPDGVTGTRELWCKDYYASTCSNSLVYSNLIDPGPREPQHCSCS